MVTNDLIILRRRETVGTIAVVAVIISIFLILFSGEDTIRLFAAFVSIFSIYVLGAYWVALDTQYRSVRRIGWTLLTLFTGPLGLLAYLLSRPPTHAVCSQCGAAVTDTKQPCPSCGHQSALSRLRSIFYDVSTSLVDSCARGPVEKARDITKQMAIALGVVVLFGLVAANSLPGPLQLLWVLASAGYWVLTAWWVYLDATWRRMEAVPWGILTLVTNVFGLVTYLVIRYPDPRACPQCGAHLSIGLKRCPYCGSEAEPTCPKCQASVKPDWVYCPSCASKLPVASVSASESGTPPMVSIRGTVVDALTGSVIPYAEVTIDSKTETARTSTDETGRFALTGLEPRPYVVIAEAAGYNSDAKPFKPGNGSTSLHFALYPVE